MSDKHEPITLEAKRDMIVEHLKKTPWHKDGKKPERCHPLPEDLGKLDQATEIILCKMWPVFVEKFADDMKEVVVDGQMKCPQNMQLDGQKQCLASMVKAVELFDESSLRLIVALSLMDKLGTRVQCEIQNVLHAQQVRHALQSMGLDL